MKILLIWCVVQLVIFGAWGFVSLTVRRVSVCYLNRLALRMLFPRVSYLIYSVLVESCGKFFRDVSLFPISRGM